MLMNISSPCQGGLFGSLGLSSSPLFYGKREESRVRRVESVKEGERERFNRVRVQRGVVVAFKKIADRRGMVAQCFP